MTEQNNEVARDFYKMERTQSVDMRNLVMRYLKYLPWLLICVLLAMIGAYIKIRYTTPIYHIQSTMLIKNDLQARGGKEDRLGDLFLAQSTINLSDETELLRSSPVIARVVKDLDLQTAYYNKGSVRQSLLYRDLPIVLQILRVQDSTQPFGFIITAVSNRQFAIGKEKTLYNFGQPFVFANNQCVLDRNNNFSLNSFKSREYNVYWQPLIMAAKGLSGEIKIVQANPFSNILTLSMETENTAVGRDVLNTLMSVYDSLIIEDKNRIAVNTMNFIDTRLNSLKDSLGGVEGNLRNFMEKNQLFDVEGQLKQYMTGISDGSKDLQVQEVQLTILNWLIDYLNKPENTYKAVPTNLGIAEPTLLQLFSDYNKLVLQRDANLKTTPAENPLIKSMENTLDKVRQNMVQALKNVREANLITRNALEQKSSQYQGQLKVMPEKSMHQLAIQRQEQILQELYYFLLQKKLETSISSASTISNSKVVEPAVEETVPIKPSPKSEYLTYFLIGLIIPIGIIAVVELMSDKVNNRLDISKATQAPILGEIGHSDTTKTLVVTSNSRHFIGEQFRIIRSNLRYITGKNETPVILVTSSFSGEGKSFVSTNMGAVMALAGKKTVVMEFDIRKPKIVSGLDLKRKMGITNYIIGSARFEDLPVKVEGTDNFFVIPCGPIPPNPAELLLSPRLTTLIESAKEHFEVIILDTAPIGLVSDAVGLSQFADCTLYIVRSKHTPRRVLGLVNELYESKKLPSLSILLNDVRIDGGYYGGYYGGYGYYGYGYNKSSGYFEEDGTTAPKGVFAKISRAFSQWFS
jgi:tyrosine-protein kinase Etk/Wzc